MKTHLLRQGYTQKPNGYFVKRVEFDERPGVTVIRFLTRDPNGVLIRGQRAQWKTTKINVDTVTKH